MLCCARRGSAEIARALLRALAGRAAAAADDARRLKLLCHVDRRFGLHPETALEAAAVAGHAAVVVALCAGAECKGENGQVHVCRADATLRNPSGRTAMHLACDRGRATVVAPLAAAGADPDASRSGRPRAPEHGGAARPRGVRGGLCCSEMRRRL